MLDYDLKSRKYYNSAAQPAPSELTYDGKTTEAFWDRMFSTGAYSEDSIRRLSAVWACVYVLSSAIGLMPFRLYKRDGQTQKEETTHRTAGFLRDAPTDSMSWQELTEGVMMQILFRGNAYGQTFFKRGFIDEVFLWDEQLIYPQRLKGGRRVFYSIGANEFGITPRDYFRPDVCHFKGIKSQGLEGITPLEYCKNSLKAASAIEREHKRDAEKGGPLRGIITGVEPFRSKDQANEIRARWAEAFQKAQGDSGVPIFEGNGMKFNPISMSNTDAQFLERMRFSVEDIARIFNLPPHQIQHLERATNNNIDLLNQEYYKSSLLPWKKRIESIVNQDWLSRGDRAAGYFIGLDPDDFLRADLGKWTDALTKQVAGGIMKPNEARAERNLPPVDHGDTLRVPANTVPVGYDPSEAAGTQNQPPEGNEE